MFRVFSRGGAALFILFFIAADLSTSETYWPQWRGPLGTGVSPEAEPPIKWSESKNIRWKLDIPGMGHSTPIIWGDLVFLTTAVPYGKKVKPVRNKAEGAHDNLPVEQHHEFITLAVSRKEGRIVWQKTLRKEFPHEGGHNTGSLASNSPATDGKHLFAFFGSRGLYCLDLKGELIWQQDLGKLQTRHAHGEGSSPALRGDSVVINWDHQGDSSVAAFDTATGEQRWKTARDEMTSWSSPLIVEHGGKVQVVVSATGRVRSYDLSTGKVIWECGGLSRNVVATPVAGHGMVFAANSYDWQALMGIKLAGAKGDITGTENEVWKLRRGTPYVPSPLLYGEWLYFLHHNHGILTCVSALTGKARHRPMRLERLRYIFASPAGAANRIYLSDRSGNTVVVSHAAKPELLAENHLDDAFSASPAMAGKELYLRGEKYLYCIAEK
ncbi:MAG: PQQ-like beta-propeller repeat protein [Planctomycetota bacterium]|jgi:outer membrane protein assembly factor BamB|nr:PQQ-like beta-propeller repeat protein [Planctomycetota bacterium]MDP7131567.1 PQQ-like beta-propeller repeat protein [Planctomycetota bacterium]MDP7252375.1 PQQ-like beta-propeller repeat protein [Planctomycetota bacterium]